MSSTTLPVCPKTGSTSPSLTVHLCLHTAPLREIGNAPLRFVGNLSRWLEREELGVEALDEQRVEAFFLARGPNSGRRGKATTGRQLLCYLRGSGVIPAAVSRPCSDAPIERVERTYERFLVESAASVRRR